MSKNKSYRDYSKFSVEPEIEVATPIVEEETIENAYLEDTPSVEETVTENAYLEEPVKKPIDNIGKIYKVSGVDLLNVRNLPDGEILGTAKAGQTLTVTGYSDNKQWASINFGGGKAYVMSKFLVEA